MTEQVETGVFIPLTSNKLAVAMIDAIIGEYVGSEEHEGTELRKILEKYVARYSAHYRDTDAKLDRALSELQALRYRAHKERMTGITAVKNLAVTYLTIPKGEAILGDTQARLKNFFTALENFERLNSPQSEEFDATIVVMNQTITECSPT